MPGASQEWWRVALVACSVLAQGVGRGRTTSSMQPALPSSPPSSAARGRMFVRLTEELPLADKVDVPRSRTRMAQMVSLREWRPPLPWHRPLVLSEPVQCARQVEGFPGFRQNDLAVKGYPSTAASGCLAVVQVVLLCVPW